MAGSCDPRAFIPLAEDSEAEELRQSQILVAEAGGRVIGFAAVKASYLSFLYVHPEHYRQGIGRELLQASLDLAQDSPWTIVLAGNDPARRLYESEAFVEVERFESDNAGFPVTCLRLVRHA